AAGLIAGFAGIVLADVAIAGAPTVPGLVLAAASGLHAALARVLLMRVAPAAQYLDAPGALARLLLWCAVVSPLPAAALAAIPAATAGWVQAVQGFVFWWLASAAGTAVLLPFMLSLAHSRPVERGLFRGRYREALVVLAITALAAAVGWQTDGMFPLLLAVPLLLWAALRLTFRITSFLCLLLAVLPMAETAAQLWPSGTPLGDAVRPGQAWPVGLMLVVVPTLVASLLAQKQRMGARAAQAALQTLRAAMDTVPAAIVTLTSAGKIGLWSRGAERVFGWRSAEVEGREPPFLAPEDVAQAASLQQRVLAGNEIRDQPARRFDRTGEPREVVINAAPQHDPDGAVAGIISVMEDVTDRRRLDSGREEQRARLAAILDALPEAIIAIDEVGTLLHFNRAAEAIFGYPAPDVAGRNIKVLMPEPDHGRHDAYLRRYRETGAAHLIGHSRQMTGRRKDGRTFPAEITISEAWIDDRRIFAGIVRDLSVGSKAGAGAGAGSAGADDGQAGFLSRITHDLRQPLHALSLMTGALERRISDPDAREIVDHLAGLVRTTQGIFENIAEWTRIERGQVAAVPSAAPVGEILASLAQECGPEAERRRLALRCVASRAVIAGDPVLVRRILRHLLDNAMKFTPRGKVLLGARRRGSMLRLIVGDTGIGVPPDRQDSIFAAHEQLDPGREAGGIGLGLAIAARLAALCGLTLGVRSVPGKGSLFWVDVPLSEA
ncbi:MAG TPA: PAS domain S-box protein, partial [Dongiaceae bacterium]|nr:PAS domain S-box protein [Dongiaceae bacterium]